jgi:hypothetical protein
MYRFLLCSIACCVFILAVQAQEQPEPEPALTAEQAAELLARHREAHEDNAALPHATVLELYKEAAKHKEAQGFAGMLDDWAKVLAGKAETEREDELADAAILLHDDGYTDLAEPLLEKAWRALLDANKAVRRVTEKREDGTERFVRIASAKFKEVVKRLGWLGYTYPADMDDCVRYDVDGALAYTRLYADIEPVFHDVGLYPPESVDALNAAHAVAAAAFKALVDQHKKDGFALSARAAWLRFKNSQDSMARFDRSKGRRSFSPRAMGRETESFDSIWTYSYARPFMLFVEKPVGKDAISPEHTRALEARAALLAGVYAYFHAEFIAPYELKRVKPQHYEQRAEEEGWPLEVVVMRDKAAFDDYAAELEESRGVDFLYLPIENRVVTYHHLPENDPDMANENLSRLAGQAFALLIDHYAAGPHVDFESALVRPRFSSLLVQHGLPAALGGLRPEGRGHAFVQAQPAVAGIFKHAHETLGNVQLLRLRDLIECRHYGQVVAKALQRAGETNTKANPRWIQATATAIYEAAATSAVYFFEQFEKDGKHPYRAKWRAFLKAELKGEHALTGWSDDAGVKAFKKAFGIEADTDWDTMEAEFLEFTLKLAPKTKD